MPTQSRVWNENISSLEIWIDGTPTVRVSVCVFVNVLIIMSCLRSHSSLSLRYGKRCTISIYSLGPYHEECCWFVWECRQRTTSPFKKKQTKHSSHLSYKVIINYRSYVVTWTISRKTEKQNKIHDTHGVIHWTKLKTCRRRHWRSLFLHHWTTQKNGKIFAINLNPQLEHKGGPTKIVVIVPEKNLWSIWGQNTRRKLTLLQLDG